MNLNTIDSGNILNNNLPSSSPIKSRSISNNDFFYSSSASQNGHSNVKKKLVINVLGENKKEEFSRPTKFSDKLKHEIALIESLLEKEFNEKKLKNFIESKLKEEKILSNSKLSILLKNIEVQLISLELAQYAESVNKIEQSQQDPNYLRLSCDPSDKLPSLCMSFQEYKFLFKYRDSSNFLFSLDKSQAQSHIFM